MKNSPPPVSPWGMRGYALRLRFPQPRQRDFSLFTKGKVTPILHSSFIILHLEKPLCRALLRPIC